MRRNPISALF